MPLIQENDVKTELQAINQFLKELDISSQYLEKGLLCDKAHLLLALPNYDLADDDPVNKDDPRYAVGIIEQLEDDNEDQLNKYFTLTSEIDWDISGMKELDLFTIINEITKSNKLGQLFLETGKEPKLILRYSFGCSTEEEFDFCLIAEAIYELAMMYQLVVDGILAAKKK